MGEQSPLPQHSQVHNLNGCDEKVPYNDSLKRLSSTVDVFLVSAFPMLNRKASQPLSIKPFNCLLLDRLLSTRCHPPSSCKKGSNKNRQNVSIAECVVRYVITCEYICVCDVCEHNNIMCI